MKPTLNKYLFSLVLAAATGLTAYADYSGGRISNMEDPSPGQALHTGSIDITFSEDVGNTIAGAVELTGAAGSGKTLTLEGDIRIKAGEAYPEGAEALNRNSGVWLGYAGEITSETGDGDNISDGNIVLKTAGADDAIVIDIYGSASKGVIAIGMEPGSAVSTVTLDSSSSGKDVVINAHHEGGGAGLAANGKGTINVVGNLGINLVKGTAITSRGRNDLEGLELGEGQRHITVSGTTKITAGGSGSKGVYLQEGAKALFASTISVAGNGDTTMLEGMRIDGSTATLQGDYEFKSSDASVNNRGIFATQGSLTVAGATNIMAGSMDALGIYADMNSQLTFSGKAVVRAGRMGVSAYSGSTIVFEDSLDMVITGETSVTASNGVFASGAGSTILLSGTVNAVNENRSGLGNQGSITAYNGGVIKDYGDVAHKYNITGKVRATGDGAFIDLKMNGQSRFTGFTALESTGTKTINLSLADASQWVVTGNSAMTELSLDGTSWLSFSLLDAESMTFANITAVSVSLAEGAVLQLMGVSSADFEGTARALNTFTANLLTAGTLTADGVKLVTADNYVLDYTNNNDGTFTVTGVTSEQLFIPEPATATLGLLGLASLMVRRRRA